MIINPKNRFLNQEPLTFCEEEASPEGSQVYFSQSSGKILSSKIAEIFFFFLELVAITLFGPFSTPLTRFGQCLGI